MTEIVTRPYGTEDVERLRGSAIEHTLARLGAERLRHLETREVPALGALTGGQAVQMVKAGLEAIYLRLAGRRRREPRRRHVPRPEPLPGELGPALARRISNALLRADQIAHAEGDDETYWLAPIVADAEAGFGGPLNAFEIMKAYIEAGAAAVHFEDQLVGEEVRPPRRQGARPDEPVRPHARRGTARRGRARRADADRRAHRRALGLAPHERRRRGRPRALHRRDDRRGVLPVHGIEAAVARGLAYAPYADLVWCETSTPDMAEAEQFAARIHERYPGKLLAYNCSPSFNWRKHLTDGQIAGFQRDLAAMGYRFQFITSPASTRSTSRCSSSRAATGRTRCPRTSRCRSASSRSRTRATRRRGTSARSAPATSTR